MSPSFVARAAELVGSALIWKRKREGLPEKQAFGAKPEIPAARPQRIPTLKMPTATGFTGGRLPTPAKGLKVTAFARNLDHPRWIEVLPSGEVLVAESCTQPGPPKSVFDHAMVATMRRAGAAGKSANRITLFADRDGDGVAEHREVFLDGLNQPFGMALKDNAFYVGNTDGLVAFEFRDGRAVGKPKRVVGFKPAGHWTRSLLFSKDKSRLYVGVGSLTNIADQGMETEEGRACIWEVDPATGKARIFAGGLRNPVGMAWEPSTGALWTVVNERDGLGDETPPDYLTSVKEGGFYGWPYSYWNRVVDDRVPQDAEKVKNSTVPDYALGGHTASLGLCWMPEGTLPGFGAGMVIGQHGSWNRARLAGYRVIHVPFRNGKPSGPGKDILTGFLSADEKQSFGRPVGVAIGPDGSLLVADDVGDAIWRVSGS
jgi:glucose/arabinose dehydrogenase